MIIWGWKTSFRVVGSGVFSCPACGADRNYERRRAQRFFTLFFIPLIPLKSVGEFVRCTYCKNDFRDSVLARPTAAQFTDLLQNTVRGVMVNMLRRGGWDHPGARAIAVQEIVNAGAVGYAEPNLAQDMQVVPEDLSQMLAGLAGQLPEAGREALVTGATRVAAADGPVQPAERAVIDSVGAALGMSQVHVAGIVAAVAGAPAAAGQAPTPTWGSGTGQSTVPAPPPTPMPAPTPTPTWGSAPATGAQDSVPAQAPASSMETMMIQAPQPAPATPVPTAGGSGMETMMIQAPQPAPATGAQDAVPQQAPASSMETMMIQAPQPPQEPQPPASSMETMLIPAPQQTIPVPPPPPTIPAPPQTLVDTSAHMETMAIPIPRPVDPADEPTHVTRADDQPPAAWPPPYQ